MSLRDLLMANREGILAVAARHGATNLRIFGSIARGEENDDSDFDFLVDLEPGRSLFDLGGLQSELEDLLQYSVDVVTVNGLKQRIRERVLREAVLL